MAIRYSLIVVISLLSLTILSCDSGITGTEKANLTPSTFLTIDEIQLAGGERLSSQISISWWGNDPDGYITGYEYAINDTTEGNFNFTTRTDSVFILPIELGQNVDDVLFKVRAVDDDGERDPVGATIVYPIENSLPSVSVNKNESAPDTTYNVASFSWSIDDPDGYQNIARTEINLNDTTGNWISIPLENEEQFFITLLTDGADAEVYRGLSFSRSGINLSGLNVDGDNTFYVRTIDQAGASSNIDSVSWYLKSRTSDILFLNDVASEDSEEVLTFHQARLAEIGISSYDYWDISDGTFGGGRKVPLTDAFSSVTDPTNQVALAQWDHIYWVSSDLDRNITYAQSLLEQFLDEGGTVFFSIPSKNLTSGDPLLNFIPISEFASFSLLQTGPLIASGSEITPLETGYPILEVTLNQTSRYPFDVAAGTIPLYEAEVQARTVFGSTEPYDGPSNIALKNPEGNLVYFGLDLRYVNGANNVGQLLNVILNDELCFDNSCQ